MLERRLEAEVMDEVDEARDYDAMDHGEVNRAFVADFLQVWNGRGPVIDVGTGTALIPIEFCRRSAEGSVVAVDLAGAMLELAGENVRGAGLGGRVRLEAADAKGLPYPDGCFPALISNSIAHHIPRPADALAEMHRVTGPGATLFVRDLLRPDTEDELRRLVDTYAAGANARQRQLFSDSLWAALTVGEVREIVAGLGYGSDTVTRTSDRHWTWAVPSK